MKKLLKRILNYYLLFSFWFRPLSRKVLKNGNFTMFATHFLPFLLYMTTNENDSTHYIN